MTDTIFDLHISLIIATPKEIEEITDFLGVEPTDFTRKGQTRSKVIPKASENHWFFTKKHRNLKEIGCTISDFFNEFSDLPKKVSALGGDTKASIRLSVISDYAQIGFCLSPQDLELLNKTNIPFEISILSWGECEKQ